MPFQLNFEIMLLKFEANGDTREASCKKYIRKAFRWWSKRVETYFRQQQKKIHRQKHYRATTETMASIMNAPEHRSTWRITAAEAVGRLWPFSVRIIAAWPSIMHLSVEDALFLNIQMWRGTKDFFCIVQTNQVISRFHCEGYVTTVIALCIVNY